LGGLTEGKSCLKGPLSSTDCFSTADVLRNLGVKIESFSDGGELTITGMGLQGFHSPKKDLDFQNSGTGARLMLGVLASQLKLEDVIVTGDNSLRKRPMGRVVKPLREAGAMFEYLEETERLPLSLSGRLLKSIHYQSPVASAQVKSALLFAGLVSGETSILSEPRQSRDHTERILESVGVPIHERNHQGRWEVRMDDPPSRLNPFEIDIPGDFSSAAFFIGLATLGGVKGGLTLENVGLNPTRTGLIDVLLRMGARIQISESISRDLREVIGSIEISPSELSGTEIRPEEVPCMIDEFPLLAILASRAEGVTKIRGVGELRFKESDRISTLVHNMRTIGLNVEEFEDGLEIVGTEIPLKGKVYSQGDHRIAMAFGILNALPNNQIQIEGAAAVSVSFPGFWSVLSDLQKELNHS
jgi:3-phosphoshikimate 1-carboxyvinyltransferase